MPKCGQSRAFTKQSGTWASVICNLPPTELNMVACVAIRMTIRGEWLAQKQWVTQLRPQNILFIVVLLFTSFFYGPRNRTETISLMPTESNANFIVFERSSTCKPVTQINNALVETKCDYNTCISLSLAAGA